MHRPRHNNNPWLDPRQVVSTPGQFEVATREALDVLASPPTRDAVLALALRSVEGGRLPEELEPFVSFVEGPLANAVWSVLGEDAADSVRVQLASITSRLARAVDTHELDAPRVIGRVPVRSSTAAAEGDERIDEPRDDSHSLSSAEVSMSRQKTTEPDSPTRSGSRVRRIHHYSLSHRLTERTNLFLRVVIEGHRGPALCARMGVQSVDELEQLFVAQTGTTVYEAAIEILTSTASKSGRRSSA